MALALKRHDLDWKADDIGCAQMSPARLWPLLASDGHADRTLHQEQQTA
jgi:hypothetical protein